MTTPRLAPQAFLPHEMLLMLSATTLALSRREDGPEVTAARRTLAEQVERMVNMLEPTDLADFVLRLRTIREDLLRTIDVDGDCPACRPTLLAPSSPLVS